MVFKATTTVRKSIWFRCHSPSHLIFGLPALRNVQPGVPACGGIWRLSLLHLGRDYRGESAVMLIWVWLLRSPREPIMSCREGHTTRSWDHAAFKQLIGDRIRIRWRLLECDPSSYRRPKFSLTFANPPHKRPYRFINEAMAHFAPSITEAPRSRQFPRDNV